MVGPDEIRDPRISGRDTSVMYTIAGLVPMAQAKPVKTRPTMIHVKLFAQAIAIQPNMQGIAASLMVFSRPRNSIITPAKRDPMGTIITIIDAIHDDCAFVTTTSLLGSSSCGIKIAEYASDMPMTM